MPLRMRNDILLAVEREMARGHDKHGPIPEDQNRALVVLVREVGELAQSLPHPNSGREGDISNQIEELTQVAAVAFRWLTQVVEKEGIYLV